MAENKKQNTGGKKEDAGQDEDGEEGGEETSASGGGGGEGGNLTSPEGILMLSVAGLLDALGFMIFLVGTWFGIDDYGILDIFGMVVIGGWMLIGGGGSGVKEATKKGLKRFGTATIIELVPFLGGIAPSWTILVYKTLKK